ncbi:hypothetical protein H2248_003922 [Termitomyces sp. 'cryptogamus']|nr:hypothetical protein H2248_003922 [Termitomyces sp. 'cryptogamus']
MASQSICTTPLSEAWRNLKGIRCVSTWAHWHAPSPMLLTRHARFLSLLLFFKRFPSQPPGHKPLENTEGNGHSMQYSRSRSHSHSKRIVFLEFDMLGSLRDFCDNRRKSLKRFCASPLAHEPWYKPFQSNVKA